ncbi:butyrate kinase [Tindallia californiensis]|uniref:Probable butyrate kinase n=1 Tax=Tindallia californiensis TaxID=159292 RepID=A0A1H3KK10_9FIRM|nr:butyrate kinase [Tindallia californiensis]SDY52552.1 butyrate kinase [Tindallia californiensis]
MSKEYVLVINPGSTSTKVAIFKEEGIVHEKKLEHAVDELKQFEKLADQYSYRKALIEDWMKECSIKVGSLRAVVGRGGLLRPMPGGTYSVTDAMIKDLQTGYQGEHASNLGGILAKAIADEADAESYIVDPVAVDEFENLARLSGVPELERKSLGHALNIKAVARRAAEERHKSIDNANFVVAHLGGGISVAPLLKGRAVDYNNANEMGPFSPERAGGVPSGDLMRMCFSGKYNQKEIMNKLRGYGGMTAYLGTNDVREVEKQIEDGNQDAKRVYEAMAYQIAKEIGAMATVLKGEIDAIIITGGMAYSEKLIAAIKEYIGFMAPVMVYPGEDEMIALNEGALRVLRSEEKAKVYEEEVEL